MNREGTRICFKNTENFPTIFLSLSHTLALLFELYHTTLVYLAIADDDDDDDSIEWFGLPYHQ